MAVDVKDVLNGRKQTSHFVATTILFIPGSTGKKAALRASKQLFKREQAWPSGAGLEAYSEDRNESFRFPLDKTDEARPNSAGAEQRPAVYRYVESLPAEGPGAAGYDSLMDYWIF